MENMGILIKDNLKIINQTDSVFICGIMEINIKVIGLMD